MLDFVTAILLTGSVQGAFLSVFLLTRRGSRATGYLGGALMCFSVAIALHILPHTRYDYGLPFHFELIVVLFLLINPLMLFYVRAVAGGRRVGWPSPLHLLPALLGGVGLLLAQTSPGHLDAPAGPATMSVSALIYGTALILHTFSYIGGMVVRLRAHAKAVRESYASLDRVGLRWLQILLVAYVATWIFGLALEGVPGIAHPWDYVWVVGAVFMYAIGYFGLRQPEVFTGALGENGHAGDQTAGRRKYQRSTLTDEAADSCLRRLAKLMEEEKPYLEGSLTLAVLADKVRATPHHLSQVINESLGMSFYDYVNSHRVDEAKRRLADPASAHLSVASIGFDAGFNSVSAYNAAFKRCAGTTPSRYRKDMSTRNQPTDSDQ